MTLPLFETLNIPRYRKGIIETVEVPVVAEYYFTLCINDSPRTVFACSGSDMESMVAGYCISEGIIEPGTAAGDMRIDTENRVVYLSLKAGVVPAESTGCPAFRRTEPSFVRAGQSTGNHLPDVRASMILKSMEEFLTSSTLHRETHGVHSAAIYTPTGRQLAFFDEIGRHNAIDKTTGYAARNGISLRENLVFSTGRIANEIITKIVSAGAAAVVSRAAPTTMSIETARKHNILMICCADSDSFLICSGMERVLC